MLLKRGLNGGLKEEESVYDAVSDLVVKPFPRRSEIQYQ